MSSSGYTAITFVANEQPTTAKWNLIGSNDASFNNGNGFEDDIILNRHIATGNLYASKIYNPYKFDAYKGSGSQNSGSGAFVKVTLPSENYDTSNNFDNVTNNRFVAPVAGFYSFKGAAATGSNVSTLIAALYKNGTEYRRGVKGGAGSSFGSLVAADIQLAANDYIELYCYGSAAVAIEATGPMTYLQGHLISTT